MTSLVSDSRETISFPSLPRLIFLDTNIVQNLHTFGELIYDRSDSPRLDRQLESRGSMFTEDIHALVDFMSLGLRAGWPFAVSRRTIDELEAIPHPSKRTQLVTWGENLAYHYLMSSYETGFQTVTGCRDYGHKEPFTVNQKNYLTKLLEGFPQEADRQLIVDALEMECDVFLTMDYKTVWQLRGIASQFDIKFMRPIELLEYVLPWAGILR